MYDIVMWCDVTKSRLKPGLLTRRFRSGLLCGTEELVLVKAFFNFQHLLQAQQSTYLTHCQKKTYSVQCVLNALVFQCCFCFRYGSTIRSHLKWLHFEDWARILTLLHCQIHKGRTENKRLPLSDITGGSLSDYMQHPLLPQKASHSIPKWAVQDVNCYVWHMVVTPVTGWCGREWRQGKHPRSAEQPREGDSCDAVQLKGLQAGTCRQARSQARTDFK